MHLQKVFILIVVLLKAFGSTAGAQVSTLSIDDCIRLTLKNNPQMKFIEGMIQSGNGSYISNKAGFFPSLNLQAQALETNGSINSSAVLSSPSPFYNANLQIQQLVYDFGKTPSRVSSSRNLYYAAQFDSATMVRNLILSAVIAYINLVQRHSVVEISIEALKQTEDHLKDAQNLFDAGKGVKFNVIKAQVDRTNAELNLIKSKNSERSCFLQLQNLVAETLDSSLVLNDTLFVKYDLPSDDSIITVALKNRSELQSLKMKLFSAQSKVLVAKRGRLPSLSVTGGYGYKIADIPINNLQPAWNFGAVVGVPLFAGGAIKGAIEQAIGEQKNVEAALLIAQQAIVLDIQQQISSCIEAAQRLEISMNAIEQAQLALSLAQERFNTGTGNAIEISDAQIQFENAKIAQVEAVCDYRIARARLTSAMGVEDY